MDRTPETKNPSEASLLAQGHIARVLQPRCQSLILDSARSPATCGRNFHRFTNPMGILSGRPALSECFVANRYCYETVTDAFTAAEPCTVSQLFGMIPLFMILAMKLHLVKNRQVEGGRPGVSPTLCAAEDSTQ